MPATKPKIDGSSKLLHLHWSALVVRPKVQDDDVTLRFRNVRYDMRYVYQVEEALRSAGMHVSPAVIHNPVTSVIDPPAALPRTAIVHNPDVFVETRVELVFPGKSKKQIQ